MKFAWMWNWTKMKIISQRKGIPWGNYIREFFETRRKRNFRSLKDNSSYGFIDKIIENLSLYINTVEINFNSEVFGGSFMVTSLSICKKNVFLQLQRLSLESRSPGWAQVKDLRQARITCSISNKALVYKQVSFFKNSCSVENFQISWHLLRIEASAKTSKNEQRSKINAPLRLITSGGKIRIALKKNVHGELLKTLKPSIFLQCSSSTVFSIIILLPSRDESPGGSFHKNGFGQKYGFLTRFRTLFKQNG